MTARKCPQPPVLSDGVAAVTCRVVAGPGLDTTRLLLTHSLDSWDVRLPFFPATKSE